MLRTILKNGLLIAVMVFCSLHGPNMPYASILNIYRSLSLALGILCCVLGAWGGIVCPAALKMARDEEKYKGASAVSAKVLSPLSLALGLFVVTLCIAYFAPFLNGYEIHGMLRVILKSCALGLSAGILFAVCRCFTSLLEVVGTLQELVNRAEIETDMKAGFMRCATRIKDSKKKS